METTQTYRNIHFFTYLSLPFILRKSIFLTLIEAITSGIIFFLPLFFLRNLHLSLLSSGYLISLYAFGSVFGGIINGKLADNFSPPFITLICLILEAFALLALSYLHNIFFIGFILFIFGFATNGFTTALNAWMLGISANSYALQLKYLNFARIATNLGFGIAGISFLFIHAYNFKPIFISSFFILLLSTGFVFFQLKNQVEPINATSAPIRERKYPREINYLMLFCIFTIGLLMGQLNSTYPIYIEGNYWLGTKSIGFLFLLDTLIITFMQAPLSYLVRNINKIFLTGCGAFLIGINFIFLAGPPLFGLAIVSCVFWTFGEMLFIPISQFVLYNSCDFQNKGRNLGLSQSTAALARILGPTLGSLVYAHWGAHFLWYIASVMGFICFLFCYYFRKLTLNTYTPPKKSSILSEC